MIKNQWFAELPEVPVLAFLPRLLQEPTPVPSLDPGVQQVALPPVLNSSSQLSDAVRHHLPGDSVPILPPSRLVAL